MIFWMIGVEMYFFENGRYGFVDTFNACFDGFIINVVDIFLSKGVDVYVDGVILSLDISFNIIIGSICRRSSIFVY